MASVLIHGATAALASSWYGRRAARATLTEEREGTIAGLLGYEESTVPRVTPQELNRLLEDAIPPIVLDVRSRSGYGRDAIQIPGSERVLPDQAIEWGEGQSPQRLVVAYCF